MAKRMKTSRPLSDPLEAEALRSRLAGGGPGRGTTSRRLPVPGDSLALLALLLLANTLRLHVPGPITDGIFVAIVPLLGFSAFRGPIPVSAKPTLLCFSALLAIYAVHLAVEFSFQGLRHLAGIAVAAVVFLFCCRNAPALIRARHAIALFLAAALAMFPVYLTPAEVNPNAFIGRLAYLLLAVGLVLMARSGNRKSSHLLGHALLLMVAFGGILYGFRALAGAVLLTIPLYWGCLFLLRSRWGAAALTVAVAALVGAGIALMAGDPRPRGIIANLDRIAREYAGGPVSSRRLLWQAALARIAETSWLGEGAGAVMSKPPVAESMPDTVPAGLEPNCLDGRNPGLIADCAILLDARKTLFGTSMFGRSWSIDVSPRHWSGVKMGGTSPRVVGLDLVDKGLTGVIPLEFGKLDRLELLRLSRNFLTGPIPPELGRLASLRVLALDDNALGGPIPPELGALENLEELRLRGNELSGKVPPALGELDQLVKLRLGANRLTGLIPPELGRLAKLQELLLGDNALSGDIPPQLGDLEQLRLLHLYQNRLTGPIPSELGELRNLKGLSLALNRLTGPIPEELGHLGNLQFLNLWSNRLSGRVPPALQRLKHLESIKTSHNDFSDAPLENSGPADAEPQNATALLVPISPWTNPGLLADRAILLTVRDILAGTVSLNWDESLPLAYWEGVVLNDTPARVIELNLPEKGLNGRIPPELGGLDRLEALRLQRNQLTGPLPPQLGRLANLRKLALSSNALAGPIPPQLGKLANLRELALDSNALIGTIPPELGRLATIEKLWLQNNGLIGPIPPELTALASLRVLGIDGNKMTGCIPQFGRSYMEHSLQTLLDLPSCGSGVPDDRERPNLGEAIKGLTALVNTFDGLRIITSTHNMLLQVGLQTGVFGMTALGFLFASLTLNLRTRAKRKVTPLQCYVAACLVLLILTSNVDVYLFQADLIRGIFAWILIGLGLGTIHHGEQVDRGNAFDV